jgi:hypothetical protein
VQARLVVLLPHQFDVRPRGVTIGLVLSYQRCCPELGFRLLVRVQGLLNSLAAGSKFDPPILRTGRWKT